jgi:hypothetical protein
MRGRPRRPSLAVVDGFHVVICGGGVAAIEGMLRLRSLAGDLVDVTLVAPNDDFVYRPVAVQEAAGFGWGRRYQLWDVTRDGGAEWVKDTLAGVDADGRVAHTGEGRELRYATARRRRARPYRAAAAARLTARSDARCSRPSDSGLRAAQSGSERNRSCFRAAATESR